MAGGPGWECELCHEKPARLFCLADDASLCWTCDASIHAANFLVARHLRSLLCHSCASPTGCVRNGPRICPNSLPPAFCSDCSSLQTKPCTSHGANPSSSSSSSCSSSSTISFAAASSSCNGSTVDSCNLGRKQTLSISPQKDLKIESSEKEEEDEEMTSGKENLGISDIRAVSSTSTFHEDKKLGSKGSSGHCNLNTKVVSFENKKPHQNYCKSSLSVCRQKYCEDRGSDEEEEEKEATSTNKKLGISNTPTTSSTSKPADELHSKDTTAASKRQLYPSFGKPPRTNGKSLNRTVDAVISKRTRR